MTSDSDNTDDKGLRDQLQLTVVAIDAAATCNAAAITGGTAIYSGDLASAAFGDSAAGSDAGDRELAANASEALCMEVEFPNGTAAVDNPFQGASTSPSRSGELPWTHEARGSPWRRSPSWASAVRR